MKNALTNSHILSFLLNIQHNLGGLENKIKHLIISYDLCSRMIINKIFIGIIILEFIFLSGCVSTNSNKDNGVASSQTNCVLASNFNKGTSSGDTLTQKYPYVINGQK